MRRRAPRRASTNCCANKQRLFGQSATFPRTACVTRRRHRAITMTGLPTMRDDSGRSDRFLQGLLLWTSLTTLIFWLPSVRGLFDGASYEWGAFGFRGRGIAGDYWFVATGSLV